MSDRHRTTLVCLLTTEDIGHRVRIGDTVHELAKIGATMGDSRYLTWKREDFGTLVEYGYHIDAEAEVDPEGDLPGITITGEQRALIAQLVAQGVDAMNGNSSKISALDELAHELADMRTADGECLFPDPDNN